MAFITTMLTQLLLEFGLFILIDSVVKTSLHSVRTSLERCRLWLLESLVLLVLATFMSLYGSVTYVLYILAFSTMASSLYNLQDDWQSSPQSTDDNTNSFPQSNATGGSLTPANGLGHYSSIGTQHDDSYYDPTFVYNDNDLTRKTPQNFVSVPFGMMRDGVTTLVSYFKGGSQRKSACVPPGLPNEGMNLCFLNSVLQCLAHVQSHCGIEDPISQMRPRYRYINLIHCYNELIANCTNNYRANVLDTVPFRRAASRLCPSLVVDPSIQKQTQQDAAEFLTWLLTTLQEGLKEVDTLQKSNAKTNSGVETLTESNRQSLKEECLMLLQTSKSMYDNRCVKAVQVLSDLDWLEQQFKGTSIIDQVFCGQILDLREDGIRSCVSIGIQAFNVLPVPLSGPRPVSGVVYLQDCLDDMCTLSGAFGEDSLYGSFSSSPIKPDSDVRSIGINGQGVKHPSSCKQTPSSSTPTKRDRLNSDGISPCKTDCRSKTSLSYLPKCLILQLNRFNEYGHKEKIPVNIPLHGLNLSRTLFDHQASGTPVVDEAAVLYDLAALCVHKGSGSSCYGHYMALCMASDGQWYCMDDEHVHKVNMAFECNSPLVRENTYLLFYIRRN